MKLDLKKLGQQAGSFAPSVQMEGKPPAVEFGARAAMCGDKDQMQVVFAGGVEMSGGKDRDLS